MIPDTNITEDRKHLTESHRAEIYLGLSPDGASGVMSLPGYPERLGRFQNDGTLEHRARKDKGNSETLNQSKLSQKTILII